MSITDELREYVWPSNNELCAIADHIDAEHEKAMSRAGQLLADAEKDRDYNYANWQECKQKVLQHNITIDELNARIECLEDELSHCIELPKDADGLYIHIGDKVTLYGRCVYEVDAIFFYENGVSVSYEGESGCGCDSADNFHHYHEPTVEDALREFAEKMSENISMYTSEAIDADEWRDADNKTIAEYAAKLRLTNDEKEQ